MDWGGVNEAVAQLARDEAARFASQATETSQTHISQVVADWIESGGTMQDLVDAAAKVWPGSRADVAAATEVTRLYASGNQAAWQASGVVQAMEWRTTEDEAVCDVCGPLSATQVAFGGEIPPAHPGCRCWIVPIVQRPGAV